MSNHVAAAYFRHLAPIDHAQASGAARQVLDRALKQVGFIPNMYANMAHAPAVLDTYLHGYGLMRTQSGFNPVEQEVVFLAISLANDCAYCVAAHSMLANKVAHVPGEVLQALREGRPLPDQRLAALFSLAQDMTLTRGRPCPQRVQALLEAGYEVHHVLAIILAISVKTLSNYVNHAFDTDLDARFASDAD